MRYVITCPINPRLDDQIDEIIHNVFDSFLAAESQLASVATVLGVRTEDLAVEKEIRLDDPDGQS